MVLTYLSPPPTVPWLVSQLHPQLSFSLSPTPPPCPWTCAGLSLLLDHPLLLSVSLSVAFAHSLAYVWSQLAPRQTAPWLK